MDFQFYPTPPELAIRAWSKFKNKNFVRVMEGSAGNGDLAKAGWDMQSDGQHHRSRYNSFSIDCCEIDASRHSVLREKGFNVVGLDFLEFGDGAIYQHIIINPPFFDGVKHVLKAWDMLWDGEVVAIINAETVRNAFSNERRLLASLIDQHGEVEFIQSAFASEDVERKTNVEIALVYLRKKANVKGDIFGTMLDDLKEDQASKAGFAAETFSDHMPAMPNSVIENMVITFNIAVKMMRESVFSEERAQYYRGMLGKTMAISNTDGAPRDVYGSLIDSDSGNSDLKARRLQSDISKKYDDLKDRAWTNILRSSNVTSHLSSDAQRRLESEFKQISKLEFTASNIFGFLCGIMEKQGEIQMAMTCDIFDNFTRYHSDNTVFYKGWKSNSKHRTCGMRLKTTRFILPHHGIDSWSSSMGSRSMQLLSDIDKVFAMIDGKRVPEVSLENIFTKRFADLISGIRVQSSYFEIRYYPGAGTIHFFPRDKALIDRLNRLVGAHRQWLPPGDEGVSKDFWLQYENAEKFDKELREEVVKSSKGIGRWSHSSPLNQVGNTGVNRDTADVDSAEKLLDEASTKVLERHGINVDFRIEQASYIAISMEVPVLEVVPVVEVVTVLSPVLANDPVPVTSAMSQWWDQQMVVTPAPAISTPVSTPAPVQVVPVVELEWDMASMLD